MSLSRPSVWLVRSRALHLALLLGLLVLNLVWTKPGYNWDMLAYTAVSLELGGATPTAAHDRTYEMVRTNLPAADYVRLTESNAYRSIVARDARMFVQQLPGYRMKIVYPWLMHQLAHVGMNPLDASVLISRIAYMCIAVSVFVWLASFLTPAIALIVAWSIMSISVILHLAALSTPDALSALFVITALWLAFEKQKHVAACVVLLASIPVRPDNLLWLCALSAILVWRRSGPRLMIAALCGIGIALSVLQTQLAGGASWQTVFYHSFIEWVPQQSTFHSPLTLASYLRVYLRETHPANLPQFALLFALLGGVLLTVRYRREGLQDNWVQLLMVLALFAPMHWLMFPDDDRFFVPAYVIILIAFVRTLLAEHSSPRDAASAHDSDESVRAHVQQV